MPIKRTKENEKQLAIQQSIAGHSADCKCMSCMGTKEYRKPDTHKDYDYLNAIKDEVDDCGQRYELLDYL